MRITALCLAMLSAGIGTAAAQGAKPLKKCAADAVVSGTVCMDKYEAGVWRIPNATTSNVAVVKKLLGGKATAADLTAAGATQLGVGADNYGPCADNGQNCANDIFAVSLPGVVPSAHLTWFQAQAACRNSLKRLPSNAEWQVAVAGTPDPGPDDGTTTCNTNSAGAAVAAGARTACVSSDGAFDMVGNLYEWVADWVPRSAGCGAWGAGTSPTGDQQCLVGANATGEPGALMRGGYYGNGIVAGPFTTFGGNQPSVASATIGLRCAR